MGRWRQWWCIVANWTFWPVLKGLRLGALMFIVAVLAALIVWGVRWLWTFVFP